MPIPAARRPPDDSPRRRSVADGDRFEVAELHTGQVQVVIVRDHVTITHAGPPELVRLRAATDCDPRDRAAIETALAAMEPRP